jgi:sugar phosphate isomerase/epimerase
MKLSLSGRLFESKGGYTLNLDEFLKFAKEAGYEGVEIRYPQLPMESSTEQLHRVKLLLRDLGLTWVFGTVEGITDDKLFERSLRTLDNNLSCGCLFTRFTVFKPEHIPAAQRFADEAAKRGAKLIMQVHNNTLPDNVPHALDTLREIDRPNVGLAYEPNHLVFAGDTRYAEAVHTLAAHISAVSIQNFKLAAPNTPKEWTFVINNKTWMRALPGDPAAIFFPAVFEALKAIRFDGFVTVMTDAIPGMDSRDLSRAYAKYLRGLM